MKKQTTSPLTRAEFKAWRRESTREELRGLQLHYVGQDRWVYKELEEEDRGGILEEHLYIQNLLEETLGERFSAFSTLAGCSSRLKDGFKPSLAQLVLMCHIEKRKVEVVGDEGVKGFPLVDSLRNDSNTHYGEDGISGFVDSHELDDINPPSYITYRKDNFSISWEEMGQLVEEVEFWDGFWHEELLFEASPKWEVFEGGSSAPTIEGAVATLYRIRGKDRRKYTVVAKYSPLHNRVQVRFSGSGCPTSYEPFLQRWVERFKESNANWHYGFKRKESREALVSYFSEWATIRVLNNDESGRPSRNRGSVSRLLRERKRRERKE